MHFCEISKEMNFFDLHWRHARLAADASKLLLKGAFHWTEPQDRISITLWYRENTEHFYYSATGLGRSPVFLWRKIELSIYQFRVNDRTARDYASMYIICVHNY